MQVAILTSSEQWFVPYAQKLFKNIKGAKLFFTHQEIEENFDVIFILSYHQIIPQKHLKAKHNIVVHASALPHGKGWAPLFWQILEGKNEIPFSMFEASGGVDDGDIYMQKTLKLGGHELNTELREKQANFTIEMCLEFLQNYKLYKNPKKQNGNESFYPKRTSKDSQLNIDKTIKEQFNLLRIVDNDAYLAFFELDGNRYILKIELDERGGVELIDFVDLNPEEKKSVLEWRNHEAVKACMYYQNDISLEEHLDFIDSLWLCKSKQYLMVKKSNLCLGVIDLADINFNKRTSSFGLYANPFEKMQGSGKMLLESVIKYTFEILKLDTLKLEVFADNEKALNLYKKYGFKESGTKTVSDKDVICMELIKAMVK